MEANQHLRAIRDLLLRKPRVVPERLSPPRSRGGVDRAPRNVHGGGRQLRRPVNNHGRVVHHSELRQEKAHVLHLLSIIRAAAAGGGCRLDVPHQENVRRRNRQVPFQLPENRLLHGQNLSPNIRVIGNHDEIVHLRRPDFLILARDQHRAYPYQLKLLPGNRFHRKKSIN
nr:hypothetical protein Itr_chr08CG00970 [Ipomoea trifida]